MGKIGYSFTLPLRHRRAQMPACRLMDTAAVQEITSQIQAKGMYDPSGPQMYEMFGEGRSDAFAPVTFALYLTADQMEDAESLEQQLSRALGLP